MKYTIIYEKYKSVEANSYSEAVGKAKKTRVYLEVLRVLDNNDREVKFSEDWR
jgi:hypothetical protein